MSAYEGSVMQEQDERARSEKRVPELARPSIPTAKQTNMRKFVLQRTEDATGTSGTGIVAEGVQFSNGQVVIHWISQLESVNVYGNMVVLEQLHGHGGRTTVHWID